MPVSIEPLPRWPVATHIGSADDTVFSSGVSGYERCLTRDVKDQARAIELGSEFAGCRKVVVLGIGGSAMGLSALVSALASHEQADRLVLLDHLDAASLKHQLDGIPDTELGLIIISRSGTTLEVMAWLRELLGTYDFGRVAVVTASPDSPLGRLAASRDWPTLSIPDDVGGRFSVFTPCGLLPAAALGLPVGDLLRGAKQADASQAIQWATDLKHLLDGGHDRWLGFFYGRALSGLSGWWLQLLSESLGKAGLPLFVAAAEGPRDQHSILQLLMEGADRQALMFNHWSAAWDPPGSGPDLLGLNSAGLNQIEAVLFDANSQALSDRGRPVVRVRIEPTAQGLAAWMQNWMRATALLGAYCDVDPFDQPGVEAGKVIAKSQLGLP
jgi:glucose-6-phosphate isomerase